MFSDSKVEVTGFTVTTDIVKSETDSVTQTGELSSNDQETQTVQSNDSSIQTDILFGLKEPPPYDAQRLASFLNKIYSGLMEELDKNDWSSSNSKHNSSNEDLVVSNLHNIDSDKYQGKTVGCLSWNSTGMSLGVSFCDQYHETWCTHDGLIHIYNTNVNNFENLPLAHALSTSSCPKCISFHPTEPSILIGGLLNGQVLVWDLRKEDDPLFSVKEQQGDHVSRHSDTITCITWLADGQQFATASKDGTIIIWKLLPSVKLLKPQELFFIPCKHSNPERTVINDHSEVLAISFFWENGKSEFVAGLGGGNVVHCSALTAEPLPLKPGFSDPVLLKYGTHSGIITSVRCTKTGLFATSGTDSEIHIYKVKEKAPIHIIHSDFPLIGIEWADPLLGIIACWGLSPLVHFYKVNTKERLDTHTVKLTHSDSQITTASFNRQRKGVIALGTQNGETSIWMVPHLTG